MSKVKKSVNRFTRLVRRMLMTAFVFAALASFALNAVYLTEGDFPRIPGLDSLYTMQAHVQAIYARQAYHMAMHGYSDEQIAAWQGGRFELWLSHEDDGHEH